MILTTQQEAQYVEKYKDLIWSTVGKFKRRTTAQRDNKDDLFQEAAIVFIKYVRSCEIEEDIGKNIPIRDMINVMCRFNLGEQVLSYPKRTTYYRAKGTEDIVHAVDYSEVDQDDRYLDFTIDQAIENMTMKSFLDSLTEQEREIVRYKGRGFKNREIAKLMGVTDVYISRTLTRMRDKYQNYVS